MMILIIIDNIIKILGVHIN